MAVAKEARAAVSVATWAARRALAVSSATTLASASSGIGLAGAVRSTPGVAAVALDEAGACSMPTWKGPQLARLSISANAAHTNLQCLLDFAIFILRVNPPDLMPG